MLTLLDCEMKDESECPYHLQNNTLGKSTIIQKQVRGYFGVHFLP